jgi:uncharacterized protein (TIGR04255 family)
VLQEYVNFGWKIPNPPGGDFDKFAFRIEVPLENGFLCVLQNGSTESPLLDTISITLDVDIIALELNFEPPYSELFDLLPILHDEKNRIFEACVTDKARELFV